jgi:regulator of sirC expression with transglutaminase-like and TPR domain
VTAAPDTSPERLALLLRLLDDDSPPVRASVEAALSAYDGDVSELLGEMDIDLDEAELELLSLLLLPSRRERLRREWIVPAGGAEAVQDDWDQFEALLRSLSDYLHDGVSLRQPLGDALDLLAEELEDIASNDGAAGLNKALFESGRFKANFREEDDPDHYDLAHVLATHQSNAIGLGLVFLFVARRLDVDVEGINLPQSFLCRYHDDGQVVLTDPAAKGKAVSNEDLAHRIRRYPREVRAMAARPATPGELLVRIVEELATAWAVRGETEDAELMEELLATLVKAPF